MDEARSGLGCDNTDRHSFERLVEGGWIPYGVAAAAAEPAVVAADRENAYWAGTRNRCYRWEMHDMVPDRLVGRPEDSCTGRWTMKERDTRLGLGS